MTSLILMACCLAAAPAPVEVPLQVGGKTWLGTVCTPFDADHEEETYKVFTHVYDFAGTTPITKGAGGKYTHHRGLFIGWKDTLIAGEDYDTWHMSNCYQQLEGSIEKEEGATASRQVAHIAWNDRAGKALVHEKRTIAATQGEDGLRVIDFRSQLEAASQPIQFRGDLQHAGMHLRLANEVSEHEDTTQYILPDGAREEKDDTVIGAWWVCASAEVAGKRYWVMHMSAPDTPGGVPVYSIRRYARFGSFFEPDLAPGKPLDLRFRIIVSEAPLDQARCAALYQAYAEAPR
jgi:hypothetical protein